MTKALLVPCSELEAVQLIDIGRPAQHLERLQELVGGSIEFASYDLDADCVLDGDGLAKRRALNVRATRYIFSGSDAAKQGRITEADRGFYYLVGNAVFTGLPDARGDITDVPARLVAEFGLTLNQGRTL